MNDELVIILREDLEIHYCRPDTMELIRIVRFKTLDDLEAYLYSPK